MPHAPLGGCIALSLLCACVPHAIFTQRGGVCPKRSAACTFELISGPTERNYEVIGVIEVEAFAVRKIPDDDAAFRSLVASTVCSAGGDAVIPGINGNGRYVLGTVVKWVDAGARGPACPKTTNDAGR